MNLKIIEQKEVPLLSRKEVLAEATFEGPIPSRKEVKKAVAKEIGSAENLVVVKKINSQFSSNKVVVDAYQYISEEEMKMIEPAGEASEETAAKEEATKPEAAKEAPKEEAKPAEEKKEEEPKEEKAEEAKSE